MKFNVLEVLYFPLNRSYDAWPPRTPHQLGVESWQTSDARPQIFPIDGAEPYYEASNLVQPEIFSHFGVNEEDFGILPVIELAGRSLLVLPSLKEDDKDADVNMAATAFIDGALIDTHYAQRRQTSNWVPHLRGDVIVVVMQYGAELPNTFEEWDQRRKEITL